MTSTTPAPDTDDEECPSKIDLETVRDQIGTGILRASDGSLVRPCTGKLTERDAEIMYRILLGAGTILPSSKQNIDESQSFRAGWGAERLRRVTVSFASFRYAATIAQDGCIYIVKAKSS